MANNNEKGLASWWFIKESLKKNSEFEGIGARALFGTIGAVLLPFEAAKAGLEALGVDFDSGYDPDRSPYDM